MKRTESKQSVRRSEKTNLPSRVQTERSPNGLFFFEDALKIEGVLPAKVITCGGWLLEFIELRFGEIYFQKGGDKMRPKMKSFGIFYPPFSITRPCFENADGKIKGIAGVQNLPENFLKTPSVFEADFSDFPRNIEQIIEKLESGANAQNVEAFPNPSIISLRAKKLIDENYRIFPSIAKIAARLNISHEHLTRQFKKDFEMSPNKYLHQLRVSDATFRLSFGEEIIKISGDVGYNDLSRFYKQFRKSTDRSPGVCRISQKNNTAAK